MKKQKQNPSALQLSLFDNAVSKHWEEIRKVEINGEMFYSILDIFKAFGEGQNPSRDWVRTYERMKEQGFEGSTDLVEHTFEGKGQRSTPIANRRAFFRIAQSTNFKHWEEIRMFMAQAADEKVESITQKKMRQTIEYYESVGWGNRPEVFTLRSQLEASISLEELKASIDKLLKMSREEWANFHSVEIKTLLGKTVSQIQKARDPKKSARGNMNPLELNALVHGEKDLNYLLSLQGNIDAQRIFNLVQMVFEPIGRNLQSTLEQLGIDPLTGKPLLASGKEKQ